MVSPSAPGMPAAAVSGPGAVDVGDDDFAPLSASFWGDRSPIPWAAPVTTGDTILQLHLRPLDLVASGAWR